MKSIIFIALLLPLIAAAQSQNQLEEKDGYFYKNGMLYTGQHKEFYDNGNLRVQMKIL
ncbi:MAG: hypothetical protein U5L09_02885 [Bacteroidales bacterium]|nr:hypothetical protein [Bacteroidales bacterium]